MLQKIRQTQNSKRKERREIKGEETGHIQNLRVQERRYGIIESLNLGKLLLEKHYPREVQPPQRRTRRQGQVKSASYECRGDGNQMMSFFFLSVTLSMKF